MASPQPHDSPLSRLNDTILQRMLTYTMTRDSPFFISNPDPPNQISRPTNPKSPLRTYNIALYSSTGETDPLLLSSQSGGEAGHRIVHLYDYQTSHLSDWIVINSTNRRIRTLGKTCFFKTKIFAMHTNTPGLLQQGLFKRLSLQDQGLALRHISSILFVDSKDSSPNEILHLPTTLSLFPRLRSCTLLFGFNYKTHIHSKDNVELLPVLFSLRSEVSVDMRSRMRGIGFKDEWRLYETMVCEVPQLVVQQWQRHWEILEKYLYPMLDVKRNLTMAAQAKKRKRVEQDQMVEKLRQLEGTMDISCHRYKNGIFLSKL